ncbi:ganglioside GM2 activator-like [Elysia marginata]|uniref:Ganglioside GM2 activator-like n=1 Tax=Elysia marginata TaxID=1093978 RepID=A0AAV4ESJ2_9GAST|nr:ganglioside GM2 activator-like [Elysia marginata]
MLYAIVFLLLGPVSVHADFSSCRLSGSNQMSATYTLSTDEIPVPGQFSASLEVQLDTAIDENVRAEVEISRQVLFWSVSVPCVGTGQGFGSCSYDDVCALLEGVTKTCNGQPCRCPISPGTYTFSNLQFSTNNLHPVIRRVARNTIFYVQIKFFNKTSGALLSCLNTQLHTTGQ